MYKNLLITAEAIVPLLRDPVWQFVGVLLALIGLLVTILIAGRQRSRKLLTCKVVTEFPLVRGDKDLSGRLEITFNGKPVRSAHFVSVLFCNSGNVPILSADYERPITLNFGKVARVLQVNIENCNPRSMTVDAQLTGGNVVLKPGLLNPSDAFTLRVLVNEPDLIECYHVSVPRVKLDVSARIVGVKDVCHSSISRAKEMVERPRQYNHFLFSLLAWTHLGSRGAVKYGNTATPIPMDVLRKESEKSASINVDEENDAETVNLPSTENDESDQIGSNFHDNMPEVFAISRSESVLIPTFASLTSDQLKTYLARAVLRLREDGIENPSERAINHYTQAIWREDNRMIFERLKIQKQLEQERTWATKKEMTNEAKNASRRLPNEGDK